MKKNLFLIGLLNLMISIPAFATTQYQKGEPFNMTGTMTSFYGGPKSAEADMWEKASNVCKELSKGENNGLLLNRLSEVVFSEGNFSSNANAVFVCLPAGSGG